VLIAPLLGVGSAYLLPDPRWARLLLGITVACALVAGVGLAALPLDRGALANLDLGPGAGVVTAAPVIASVIIANTLGTIAVVGVALRSLLAAVFRARPWTLVWGNGLIAAGTLIIAAAGSLARLGHGVGFWGTMTIGWIVLYGGFALLAAGTAPATRPVAA